MKIGFRLDSNEYVASGHMNRCVTIAKELKILEYEVVFFLAEDKNTDILRQQDMPYVVINGHWDDFDKDIENMIARIRKMGIDVLVVDSYKVTNRFLSQLNQKVPVFLFDDFCNKKYDVSTVLHISEWKGNEPLVELYRGTSVKTISGLQYVPLREEFIVNKTCDKKKQILITTGGTDHYHVSYQTAELLLKEIEFEDYSVLVVCGLDNHDYDKLCQLQEEKPRLKVVRNVSNMAELMWQSMFAVSAGGMTIYELCAVGCPTAAVAISDDQIRFLEEMQKLGIVLYAGDVRKHSEVVYDKLVRNMKILLDETERKERFDKMQHFIDGSGAYRIANEIVRCGGRE